MSVTFTEAQVLHVQQNVEKAVNALRTQAVDAALGANWFKCSACKIGLNAVAAAPIAAALAAGSDALEGAEVVDVVATFFRISRVAAKAMLASIVAAGATSVEQVIDLLCEKMKACK